MREHPFQLGGVREGDGFHRHVGRRGQLGVAGAGRDGEHQRGGGGDEIWATHFGAPAKALAPFGWTGRRAEWIALACSHGGAVTRAQWTSFLGCHHEKVRRAVRKLVAQGVAIEEKPPGINGIGRIGPIRGRRIYEARGAGDHRRRRITSPEVLMRRLLALDYVLEHPRLPWLPTEADRVGPPSRRSRSSGGSFPNGSTGARSGASGASSR
ncbi:MAG: hypothetical protein OXQ94_16060 [Gemmatimonadota bacterium]|nr:hypothetical protein [Gemmatimonadota bacterium]